MGRVGVEEAAAVRAEHLDRDLARHGAQRDRLLGALERRRIDIRRRASAECRSRPGTARRDADRQQHVERATREVDPERTDGRGRSARETADERHGERDAGRGRQEVLVRQPQHLREVGQRALAAVVLPVRVGDEARRRVEGEIRRHGALAGGIERQSALEPQNGVEDQKAANVEIATWRRDR